ncbi:hypothetical protein B7494_g8143 [Chlorociboria aeruginascens]|nr:hypothetical protein B7494_g8143 [Chlorociboria aeruginascens]
MSSAANDGSSQISAENDSWRSEYEMWVSGDSVPPQRWERTNLYGVAEKAIRIPLTRVSQLIVWRMGDVIMHTEKGYTGTWAVLGSCKKLMKNRAPNDERQNENLDISHHKFLLLLDGKLFLAPIPKDVKRVLDLGTGTGIWAIDFADEYPDASILGIDLSPIQPSMVPPNCRFEIDDAADEFTYPPDHFDFIHVRGLYGSISDWSKLYSQIFRHTAPGGWFEQVEISIDFKTDDGTIKPGSPLLKLTELFTEAGEISGQTFRTFEIMKPSLEAAGFVNVVERIFKSPIGTWPSNPKMKELGRWGLLGLDVGLEGYTMAPLTRLLGWNANEVHVLLQSAEHKCALHYEIDESTPTTRSESYTVRNPVRACVQIQVRIQKLVPVRI